MVSVSRSGIDESFRVNAVANGEMIHKCWLQSKRMVGASAVQRAHLCSSLTQYMYCINSLDALTLEAIVSPTVDSYTHSKFRACPNIPWSIQTIVFHSVANLSSIQPRLPL